MASGLLDTAFLTIEGLFDTATKNHTDLWLTKAARVMFMSYFVELPAYDEAGLKRVWQGLNAARTHHHKYSRWSPHFGKSFAEGETPDYRWYAEIP